MDCCSRRSVPHEYFIYPVEPTPSNKQCCINLSISIACWPWVVNNGGRIYTGNLVIHAKFTLQALHATATIHYKRLSVKYYRILNDLHRVGLEAKLDCL
jgi:hypothetical protein